ncbi:collagenase [Bacillus timonensis]|uniref:collagenase n=1 Tax=Bacillus timonensis TaxID=1033734 RepID=UPI000288BD53|nr:collagenase [Bacillus timonensis]
MRIARNILFLISSLVLTAFLIAVIYLFVNNIIGLIILVVGLIALVTLMIIVAVGLGKRKFLFIQNKSCILLTYVYLVATIILLCGICFYHFILHYKFGDMSVGDKLKLLQQITVVREISETMMTKDYPVLEHQHITFKYHPETEKQVYKLIESMEEIKRVEEEMFGQAIAKRDPLEVVVLRNSNDYYELMPFLPELIDGAYDNKNKTVLIYQNSKDETFMVGAFAHEYTHYLLDLFSLKVGLQHDDVPLWYNEGISEYIHYQIIDTPRTPGILDTNLSFSDLHTSKDWNSASESSDTYYLAKKAIDYLVGQHGKKILASILLDQKETDSFEVSFEKITGLQLSTLNQTIFSVNEELDKAWRAWQEGDNETAEKMYLEIIRKYPDESLAWHQFALLLEEQQRWDEALEARRKVSQLTPNDGVSFLNLSYLLIIFNTKESLDMANKALELSKMDSFGNVPFYQEWVNEISIFHQLKNQGKEVEAYRFIFQSEQLSNQTTIMGELKRQAKEKYPGEF